MSRLGRGLKSLIHEAEVQPTGAVHNVSLENISVNPYQPRKIFDKEKLEELAESIKENGLIQPIVVSEIEEGIYQLIAGERRFEACKMIGMKEIPVYIKKVDEKEKLVLAVIENIHRENLSPIEEAKAFQQLIDDFELTHLYF